MQDINWRLVTQGVLLCLFTCIRTATPSTFFFTLPFIADCLPSFPPISIVSAVVSTVRLLSTALVALYPKECLELLAILSFFASIFGFCSDFYVDVPDRFQGYWVFASAIFIFFCSGSSIARALIVTEDSQGDLEKMSNVYTCAKEAVFIVSFVISAFIITHGCWTGFGVWVCGSYGLIFTMCAFILIFRRRSLFFASLFRMSDSYDSLDGCEDEEDSEQHEPKSKNIILNFIQDMRCVPRSLWLFVQFAESIGVVSGIVGLSAVMLVKDKWQLSRVETSVFTLLPMALTLPAFLLTTCIPCSLTIKLLLGMFVPATVAVIPFAQNPYAIGFIIFSCELANSLRLAAMTPIMNSFMNSKQTTIRLVSIVTLLSFFYKTIGLSFGAYLFTWWQPLPFMAAGFFQVINAMGILALKPYIDNQLAQQSVMERKTLLDHH